ncbi:MAG: Unknown protein, partial [uncultured Aureispira sp.]
PYSFGGVSYKSRTIKILQKIGYQSTKETIYLGAKWKHSFLFLKKCSMFSKKRGKSTSFLMLKNIILQTIKLIE